MAELPNEGCEALSTDVKMTSRSLIANHYRKAKIPQAEQEMQERPSITFELIRHTSVLHPWQIALANRPLRGSNLFRNLAISQALKRT